MAGAFAGSRVVPRTACPPAASSRASSRPRQPQGTIRTRATSVAVLAPVARALLGELGLVPTDAVGDLLLVALGQAALAAHGVLGLDHLRDVVDVVLGLHVGRPGGLPVEDV